MQTLVMCILIMKFYFLPLNDEKEFVFISFENILNEGHILTQLRTFPNIFRSFLCNKDKFKRQTMRIKSSAAQSVPYV
jgi:hypothetical protein